MRIRKKKWAPAELAACTWYESEAWTRKGHWAEFFPKRQPLAVELGCGKGFWLAEAGKQRPDVNFLGIDLKSDILAVARRNISAALDGAEPENVRLTCYDISRLGVFMDENDSISELIINFCNPWPKEAHKKKRLTHPKQLALYEPLLIDGALLRFKTDDAELFEDSIGYLTEEGFEITELIRDLYAALPEDNIATEHERMFVEAGKKIMQLKAVWHRK